MTRSGVTARTLEAKRKLAWPVEPLLEHWRPIHPLTEDDLPLATIARPLAR
jgi:hypothetical protein